MSPMGEKGHSSVASAHADGYQTRGALQMIRTSIGCLEQRGARIPANARQSKGGRRATTSKRHAVLETRDLPVRLVPAADEVASSSSPSDCTDWRKQPQ